MDLRQITQNQKSSYNRLVTHVIQSWEWGEARAALGLPVLRYGLFKGGRLSKAFQLTLHKIPFTRYFVGYLPKGPLLDKELFLALEKIARQTYCAFIKIEPNIITGKPFEIYPKFIPSPKPLFTKYNFLIDLTKTEEGLLKSFHPKTRYNIKLAQKHQVKVEETTDDSAFKIYLKLYFETAKRQNYFGHNEEYHKQIWKTLKAAGMARLLIAFHKKTPLVAWMLLNFKDTLYYPYGGSSEKHREVMASNLVAWEAIKLGKKLNLKTFDMWGALGRNPDPKDPWFGFHRFKAGYGGDLIEYIGSFDLVFNPTVYFLFTGVDRLTNLKVFLLKLLGR